MMQINIYAHIHIYMYTYIHIYKFSNFLFAKFSKLWFLDSKIWKQYHNLCFNKFLVRVCVDVYLYVTDILIYMDKNIENIQICIHIRINIYPCPLCFAISINSFVQIYIYIYVYINIYIYKCIYIYRHLRIWIMWISHKKYFSTYVRAVEYWNFFDMISS
jgi:hypothetical protein